MFGTQELQPRLRERDLPRTAESEGLVGVEPGSGGVARRCRTQRDVEVDGAAEVGRAGRAGPPEIGQEAAVVAFVDTVGPDASTSLLLAELRQLGGALGRPHEGGGVLSQLDASFLAFAGGVAATPELGARAHADAVRLTEALRPWSNGRQYLNVAETAVDTRDAYAEGVWLPGSGRPPDRPVGAPVRRTTLPAVRSSG
jgi:hypothetical protein